MFKLQRKNLVCRNNLPYELLSEAFAFSYDDTGSTKQAYAKNKIFIRECNIYNGQIAMTENVMSLITHQSIALASPNNVLTVAAV